MPVNIEIKARAEDWPAQLKAGRVLADRTELLSQNDVFFNCANGSLKLRRQRGAGDYLVFYRRSGVKGAKPSSYTLVPVVDAAAVRRSLSQLLGVTKTVIKKRLVCFAGRTRIHFDEVKGLGRFIELEVGLKPGESPARGRAEAARLMRALGIRRSALLACAYADML